MKRRNSIPDPDGILPLDKPCEWTSHDLVAKIRNHFQLNKVGHGGTLDPNATGLVLLLIGRGTRLSARVMGSDKTYEGELLLGTVTNTQDIDGEVISTHPFDHVTREAVEAEMARATGDQMQIPPMVSAIKKDGVPLYKLARKGQEIEREPRFIHLYSFELLEIDLPRVRFRVRCTKGTYVRTLAHDLGTRLGCGATLSQLRRTFSGPFSLEQAYSLDTVLSWTRSELEQRLVPLHAIGTTG